MRVLVMLAAFIAMLSSGLKASAEWTPGYYMAQSLDTCFNAADRFLGETEYGYAPQISLVGTYMSQGDVYPMLKNFERNGNYVIIAAGDEDATDVDIRVLDGNGNVLAEDMETDSLAVIEFNVDRDGQYRIEAELFEAEQPSFVSFVILQEGGWYVPRREFDIAKETMFGMCAGANDGAEDNGLFVQFNDTPGQATIFGGLLGGEEGTMLTNLRFGDGDVLIVAAGDSDVEDIDLTLLDDRDQELTADQLPDAKPVLTHTTSSQERYKVDISSEATQDSVPTYCIVGLLLVRPQ